MFNFSLAFRYYLYSLNIVNPSESLPRTQWSINPPYGPPLVRLQMSGDRKPLSTDDSETPDTRDDVADISSSVPVDVSRLNGRCNGRSTGFEAGGHGNNLLYRIDEKPPWFFLIMFALQVCSPSCTVINVLAIVCITSYTVYYTVTATLKTTLH